MNKEIYSISGENLSGSTVEIFKAGFNDNNEPMVQVGTNEVSIDNVITAPSGGTAGQVLTKTASAQEWADINALPEGGTIGQVLTKTATASAWQDIKALPEGGTVGQILTKTATASEWADNNPVEANPAVTGSETALNTIKIGDVKYKIGGLPESTTGGDALVFNGTEWAKQDSYGYTRPAGERTITWDGDPTGYYDPVGYGSMALMTTAVLSSYDDYIGKKVKKKYSSGEEIEYTITHIEEQDGLHIAVYKESEESESEDLLYICLTDQEIYGYSFYKGVYFLYTDGYTSEFTTLTPDVLYTIDKKYIYDDSDAGTVMLSNGEEWVKQTGYGYDCLPYDYSLTWDGNTEGLETYNDYYKISDEAFDPEGFTDKKAIIVIDGVEHEVDILSSDHGSIYYFGKCKISDTSYYSLFCTFTENYGTITKGTYFYYNSNNTYYTAKVNGLHASEPIRFNEDYIYPSASTGSGLIKRSTGWESVEGYAYHIPEVSGDIIWDGDITGHETCWFDVNEGYVKISDTPLDTATTPTVQGQVTSLEAGQSIVTDVTFQYYTSMYGLDMYIADAGQLFSAQTEVSIESMHFTPGLWSVYEYNAEEDSKFFISKLLLSTPEQYITFNPNYIPIKFNQDITNKFARNIQLGDDTYVVTSIEETTAPNRIIRSTSTAGELVWTPPFEFQATTTITGDGTKDQFYIKHNFGNKLITHICKDSSGAEVTVTGTAHNNLIYSIKFSTPPASGVVYTVELKPTKVVETMPLVLNEYDILPLTSTEAESLGYIIEEV